MIHGRVVAPIILTIKKKAERVAGDDDANEQVYYFEDLMQDAAADLCINLNDDATAVNSEHDDHAQ